MEYSLLPPGWILRSPSVDELPSIMDLIAACDQADFGAADTTIDNLQAEWQRPGFDLATNAWLLIAPDGKLAGYTISCSSRLKSTYLITHASIRPSGTR